MLDQSLRIAILELHKKGNGIRAIARAMKLSRGAVREVVRASTAEVPPPIKGSNTTSPGLENVAITSRTKSGANRAG